MDFLTELKMPLCQKTRIPVKTLIEQIGGDSRSKKIIEKHVASINLVSLLNEQTIRIRSYKDDDYSFQVIYVLDIVLKECDQMTDFTELVHSAFPESTLLLMEYRGDIYISGALKRINKNDNSKTVIEDSVWAKLPAEMNINVPSTRNLKEYYEYILRLLYRIKAQNVTGVFPREDGEYKPLIKQYESLSSQINKLNDEYSAASMRNEKMRIDNDLYEIEQELNRIRLTIGGGYK